MNKAKKLPVHYRYDDYMLEGGVGIRVRKFYPLRETPCFYMVVNEFENKMLKITKGRSPKTKRVSKNGVRRYCYPSKEQALHSYKKRKLSQIRHAELSLAKANQALFALKDLNNDFDNLDCGRPDYWDNLIFD
jgi:hypothetical protein